MNSREDPESPLSPDALLRETLSDDLPPDVEARLEQRLEGFLASRVRGRRLTPLGHLWQALTAMPELRRRGVIAVSAAVLMACGLAWHATAGPPALAESLTRVQLTVAIADALRAASSMHCTGEAAERFHSPADLAARLYGAWVQTGAARRDGAILVNFAGADDGATYELSVDPVTMRPYELRRTVSAGSGPHPAVTSSGCTLVVRPSGRTPRLPEVVP